MGEIKTVLEIMKLDLARRGHVGPITKALLDAWRASHPCYGKYELDVRFWSGSKIPVKSITKTDRVLKAWIAEGKPKPIDPAFDNAEFGRYSKAFVDEYEESFYV